MEKVNLPIKTKIAAWWMLVSSIIQLTIGSRIFDLLVIAFGLASIFLGIYLLKNKKRAWYLAAIIFFLILTFHIIYILLIPFLHWREFVKDMSSYIYSLKELLNMNPQVMIWTIFDFIIFLPPLILLLLDYRNFMKDDFEVTKPSLPTRNKFLITILIVIIIVFVGKWFFWSGRNIYMNTDKTEYERKKEILVTVKTELIRPVFFYNASSFCRVFHKVGGEWDISYNIDLDRYNKVGFNNYVYKWDQMHNKWHSEEKYLAPPG